MEGGSIPTGLNLLQAVPTPGRVIFCARLRRVFTTTRHRKGCSIYRGMFTHGQAALTKHILIGLTMAGRTRTERMFGGWCGAARSTSNETAPALRAASASALAFVSSTSAFGCVVLPLFPNSDLWKLWPLSLWKSGSVRLACARRVWNPNGRYAAPQKNRAGSKGPALVNYL